MNHPLTGMQIADAARTAAHGIHYRGADRAISHADLVGMAVVEICSEPRMDTMAKAVAWGMRRVRGRLRLCVHAMRRRFDWGGGRAAYRPSKYPGRDHGIERAEARLDVDDMLARGGLSREEALALRLWSLGYTDREITPWTGRSWRMNFKLRHQALRQLRRVFDPQGADHEPIHLA